MRRRKLRTLEDLCCYEGDFSTKVLNGGWQIQGLVDESDCVTQRTMELVCRFPSGKVHEREESGKCNVCSSPCLSCVHLNPSLAPVTLKPDKHTSSEMSNVHSGCCSHDSFSETEESKASLRTSDTSEGTVMLSNVAAGQILEPQIFCGNRIISSQHEKQKVLEFSGDDNISCISRVDSPSKTVGRKSNPSGSSSLRDLYAGASSSKRVLPECSVEQVESSSARVESISIDCYKHVALDCVESVRPEGVEGDPATKLVKCLGQNESSVSLKAQSIQGHPVQSQQLGCSGGSDLLEDVRVCDICGDAGREDLLAICSKCCDGAEHIYCMRVRLDKLPKGDWFCEECLLRHENEKEKQKKFGEVVGTSKGSSSNSMHRKFEVSTSSNSKAFLESDSKRRNVDKGIRDEVSSIPYFSTKRRGGQIESSSEAKRRALETSVGSHKVSIHNRMGPSSRDSPLKNIGKTSSVDHSYNLGNARFPTISVVKSQKSQSHPIVAQGILSKSHSFHISAPKPKVRPLEEACLQKQKSFRESATSEKRKGDVLNMMSKSMSFDHASSSRSNAAEAKIKLLSPKFSHVENLKRPSQSKERDSIQTSRGELDNTRLSSPTSDTCISTSKIDNKSAMAVQRRSSSSNSSKSSDRLVHEGSKSSDHFATPGILKRLPSYLSNAAGSATPDLSREQMKNVSVPKDNMQQVTESCQMISPQNPVVDARPDICQSNKVDFGLKFPNQPDASRILAVPEVDAIWKGGFEIQSSKRLPNICFGIQAHLSTCASPKVPGVVKMFPRKVLLEEVPRLGTWPTQFVENHPKEESIGLYFFAEDLESYMRNYKSLSEYMIDYDVALRGNFDGIELLIFSSKVLPEKSQRWNKMFFLWGVFRERKVNDVEHNLSSSKKNCDLNMNSVSLDQDLSTPRVPGPRSMTSSGNSSENFPESKLIYNVQESSTYADSKDLRNVPSRRRGEDCKLRISSSEPKHFSSLTNFVQHLRDDNKSSPLGIPIKVEQLSGNIQHTTTFLKEHGVSERSNKEDMPYLQASNNYNMDSVILSGACNMEVAEDSRLNNNDDPMKSEFLGLGLSLEARKISEILELMPSSLGIVDEKKKIASKEKKDDNGDEFPDLLKLSLALPSYD